MTRLSRLSILRAVTGSLFVVFVACALSVDLNGCVLGLPKAASSPIVLVLFCVVPLLAVTMLIIDAAWRWFAVVMLLVYLLTIAPMFFCWKQR